MGESRKSYVNNRYQVRIKEISQWADGVATTQNEWARKSRYFHRADQAYLRFLIPEGLKVLELGCATGDTLASLSPAQGIGVDISPQMIKIASIQHPDLTFLVGDIEDIPIIHGLHELGPFDVILLDSTLGFLDDIQTFLKNLAQLCTPDTRLISTYHSYFWEPIFTLAGYFRLRMPTPDVTWLRMGDVENFMSLSGYETIKREWRLLFPYNYLGLGKFVNRYVAVLPLIRKLCLRHYLVARIQPSPNKLNSPSATIVIPCKNERGNIEPAIQRLPKFCDQLEVIFVEGHSTDGTWTEVQRVQAEYPEANIKILQQPGEGKGDAVRAGFDKATGDILIILDADLTVPPEGLPKFYHAIAYAGGEYINGSRLVYAMDSDAMRFLNRIANHIFALVFSYLLNQTFTGTLCGTKALSRHHYQAIAHNRAYFGNFDPFGDFDLIFGATKLNLKLSEIPIRYASRNYGRTQISRFRHGVLLVRMIFFAYRKLKAL